MRGATQWGPSKKREREISTHAPLAGRDLAWKANLDATNAFQPTRPLRGATGSGCCVDHSSRFQPTRPLRGATTARAAAPLRRTISTHAPLAGRDIMLRLLSFIQCPFQPTRPLRGATMITWMGQLLDFYISTHAPLAGRDYNWLTVFELKPDISTHAPLAGRDWRRSFHFRKRRGISTHAPLAGRDLRHRHTHAHERKISTHAPLAGRDLALHVGLDLRVEFQPTRPLRGATQLPSGGRSPARFQPTRPLRGATRARPDKLHVVDISTHAPLAGRDLLWFF